MQQYYEGPVTTPSTWTNNPLIDAVLADTGALPAGIYEVRVVAGADAACRMRLEHRNAANDANLSDTPIIFPVGANAPVEFVVVLECHSTKASGGVGGERFRVAMDAALTGNAAATVNVVKQQ